MTDVGFVLALWGGERVLVAVLADGVIDAANDVRCDYPGKGHAGMVMIASS